MSSFKLTTSSTAGEARTVTSALEKTVTSFEVNDFWQCASATSVDNPPSPIVDNPPPPTTKLDLHIRE